MRPSPAASEPVALVGPIDTPEELDEAFRRIDEVRQGRRETRQAFVDRRIAEAIAQRRAAGLPAPTPEEEARLRERIDASRARRAQIVEQRTAVRREAMERKVENGEPLTREDILVPSAGDGTAAERRERIDRWRSMSPEERREALRQMPPEERRALIDRFRARRGISAPAPTPDSGATPAAEAGVPAE